MITQTSERLSPLSVRQVQGLDGPFLQRVVYMAGFDGFSKPPDFEETLGYPHFGTYYDEWGRPGDNGVVAEDAQGRQLGAALCRVPEHAPEVSGQDLSSLPEVIIAVLHSARRQGIGGRMLGDLKGSAKDGGAQGLFLKVAEHNRTALNLYVRHDFKRVGRLLIIGEHSLEPALIMRVNL